MLKSTVFLDRDGVLIHDRENYYLSQIDQVELYTDVPAGLKKLKEAGYLLIVVTNQSGVARGYFDEKLVNEVYHLINQRLKKEEVQLDAIYYCPHHVKGKAPYNIQCDCRKPALGMLKQACYDFAIDLSHSFLIGDKLSDIEMGVNGGVQSIQLLTGHGKNEKTKVETQYPTTPIFSSFSQAVEFILRQT
jgi:D-glycero-D-manno-heptose 1,7-bisphosphate phosphatase